MGHIESYVEGLAVLEQAGLDVVAFSCFIMERVEDDYRWPDIALEEFFSERMRQIAPYHGPFGASFFKAMGIVESHLDKMVERYRNLTIPLDQLEFLLMVFVGIAPPLGYGEALQPVDKSPQPVPKLEPRFIDPHLDNMKALKEARPPHVVMHVQKRGANGIPSYDEKQIQVFEELPIGPDLLYHTTSLENATNIVENGPLVPLSRVHIDFEGGFYLNTNPSQALLCADHCATPYLSRAPGRLAITLVYKADQEFRDSLSICRITGERWKNMVYAFRLNRPSFLDIEEFLENDVIIGPKCRNPSAMNLRCPENPYWDPIPYGNQVAFTNSRAANRLKNHLYGVMIHKFPY